MQKTVTFLMFAGAQFGKAKEAIELYTSLFDNSEIRSIHYWGENEPGGRAGAVKRAVFTIAGTEYMITENSFDHKFGFTPSISIYVRCESEQEVDAVFGKLSKDGSVMMPLGKYPFSARFGWLADRYGVSWQIGV